MSGGGIGKVFSKVVKVFTKVAPIVLAAAAVVFTAGAGLAAAGVISSTSLLGGGLGAAMSTAAGSMGLSGTLGSVVAGALTSAAYGSAIGGVFGAVSGGNVMKGMQMGALSGAVTGGVMGGLSGPLPTDAGANGLFGGQTQGALDFGAKIDPIGNFAKDFGSKFADAPGAAASSAPTVGGPSGAANLPINDADALTQLNAAQASPTAGVGAPATTSTGQVALPNPTTASAGAAGSAPATSSGGGLLSGLGDLAKNNPQLTSSVAGGLIQGGGAYLAGSEQADAQKQATEDLINGRMAADQAKAAQIASNYSNVQAGGLLTQADVAYTQAQDGSRPTPTQKYDPRAYNGQWVYNAQQGRIVFVPNTATA